MREVWIIAESFVVESYVGGMMLGNVSELDMSNYRVVGRYTQAELDQMMEEYYEEHGHYPE